MREDMLAKLLVEIREEAVASHAVISQSGDCDTAQNLPFSLTTHTDFLPVADAKESPVPKGCSPTASARPPALT